jgi:hypothetical protein
VVLRFFLFSERLTNFKITLVGYSFPHPSVFEQSVDQRLDLGFVALKLMGEVAAAWAASSAGDEVHGVRVFCAARFISAL